jgi:hypothetical protein
MDEKSFTVFTGTRYLSWLQVRRLVTMDEVFVAATLDELDWGNSCICICEDAQVYEILTMGLMKVGLGR